MIKKVEFSLTQSKNKSWCLLKACYVAFLSPANEVCEGYVFTPVCQSFCSQAGVHGRGRAWGCCAWGHGWWGEWVVGGVHGGGHVWWGHAWRGPCMVGGMCGRGACVAWGRMTTPPQDHETRSVNARVACILLECILVSLIKCCHSLLKFSTMYPPVANEYVMNIFSEKTV